MVTNLTRGALLGASALGLLLSSACKPTLPEIDDRAAAVPPPCIHRPGSRKMCPDTTFMTRSIPIDSVLSIELMILTADGDSIISRYPPEEVDAIFLTYPAVRRFVVPYYRVREGTDSAEAIEERYRRILP